MQGQCRVATHLQASTTEFWVKRHGRGANLVAMAGAVPVCRMNSPMNSSENPKPYTCNAPLHHSSPSNAPDAPLPWPPLVRSYKHLLSRVTASCLHWLQDIEQAMVATHTNQTPTLRHPQALNGIWIRGTNVRNRARVPSPGEPVTRPRCGVPQGTEATTRHTSAVSISPILESTKAL